VRLGDDPIPSRREAMPVRLFSRKRDEQQEIPCPRCKVMVPVGDDVCNVCGWDMLDQYRPPAPAPQEDRVAP
jgi:hypothetical protein